MTERSLYPANVEVRQRDLAFTESSKSEQIRQRTIDTFGAGRITGLEVEPYASDTTLLQVSTGRAYMPNGELSDLDVAATAIALSDPTSGAVNLVCLVYTETEGTPAAHEFDGTTRNTRATASTSVRVYTQAELNALPGTLPDQTQVARDRVAVIAEVEGAGASTAIPSSNITQGPLGSVLTSVQSATVTPIPGVEFLDTSYVGTGTGTLRINATSRSADANDRREFTLEFLGPGGTYGSAVSVTGTGEFTLTSGTTSDTLTVFVDEGSLPQAATTTTNLSFSPVYVLNDYDPANPEDAIHRQRQGTLAPTASNPHGQALQDLASSVLRGLPVLLQKTAASAVSDVSPADRPALVTRGNTHGAFANPVWELHSEALQPNNAGASFRVYLRSDTAPPDGGAVCLTVNARYSNEVGPAWSADDTSAPAQRIVLGSDDFNNTAGNGIRFDFASTSITSASWAEPDWEQDTLNVQSLLTSLRQLQQVAPTLEDSATGGAGLGFTLLASFGATDDGSLTTASDYSDPSIRIYQRYVTDGSARWIHEGFDLTYNASWNAGSAQWDLDAATVTTSTPVTRNASAWRLKLVSSRAPGSVPFLELLNARTAVSFVDADWDRVTLFDENGLRATDYLYQTNRAWTRTLDPSARFYSAGSPTPDTTGLVIPAGTNVFFPLDDAVPVGARLLSFTVYVTIGGTANLVLGQVDNTGTNTVVDSLTGVSGATQTFTLGSPVAKGATRRWYVGVEAITSPATVRLVRVDGDTVRALS